MSWLPGHSVQKKNGPLALYGDVSADLHETLVFVMFSIELLLENCTNKEEKHRVTKVFQEYWGVLALL